MGHDVVRAHVNMPSGERQSVYFHYTDGNIASFIAQNAGAETRIAVENIFGRTIIKTCGVNGAFDGVQSVIKKVGAELEMIRSGKKKAAEFECYELSSLFGYEGMGEQF
ncbi:MAG: hypothetical protein K2M46_08465 [Lachnospiraceae bacterium]|nr:hypothetical protein [Lachnospiraceae bacterium]